MGISPQLFAGRFAFALVLAFLAGNLLQFSDGFSAFWAPVGVSLVALLFAPFSWWPALLLAITLVDISASRVMFGHWAVPDDALKVGAAAALVRRFEGRFPYSLSTFAGYLKFVACCTLCFASCTFFTAPNREVWVGFWLGDLLGATMIVPFFFLERAPQKRPLRVESVLTVAALFLITTVFFLSPRQSQSFALEFPYLILPLLLWLTLRLPDRVVALATVGVAAISVYGMGQGVGPFVALPIPLEERVLLLQSYLLVVTTGPVLLSLGLYERKSASSAERGFQDQLQSSNLNFRTLFETSAVAIAMLSEDKVVESNRRFQALFALREGDDFLSGAPERQSDGSLSEERRDEILHRSCHELCRTNWTTRLPDGSLAELELHVFTLPESRVRAVTAVDVTESKRLVDTIRAEQESLSTRVEVRTQELREKNLELTASVRAKSEMVGLLSHELKTPLTALMAHTETLLEQLYGPLNDQQVKAVTEMRDNTERLSRLVLELLDLHRLEADQVPTRESVLPLWELVNSVLLPIKEVVERRHLEFQWQGQKEVLVVGDRQVLARVFSLLLGRAARQSSLGTAFGIRVENEPPSTLKVRVWDSGAPISAEAARTLIDPYAFRSERENRAETGVALPVAHGLLQTQKGDLSVESNDQGTTILLTLRAQK